MAWRRDVAVANKATGFDVWLLTSQRVYRAVPFDVLTDWLQQGRVTADDKVRPSGQGEWKSVGEARAFAAFLPSAEPRSADDAAEAFEPVHMAALPIRRRYDDDDDDVDMIPLIDISLVLLIFFMMTATVAISGADIETPTLYHGSQLTTGSDAIWLGADKGPDGAAVYSIGTGNAPAKDEDRSLTLAQVVERLKVEVKKMRGVPVRIAGHRGLPFGAVQVLTAEVEKLRGPGGVTEIKAEVSERSS